MDYLSRPAYFVDGKPKIQKGSTCGCSSGVALLSLTLRNDPATLHVLCSYAPWLQGSLSMSMHICESPFPFLQETSEAVVSPRPAASWGVLLGAHVAGRAPRITQGSFTPQYVWQTFCSTSTR